MGYTRENLEELNMKQLKEIAKGVNIDIGGLKKGDLIDSILNFYNTKEETNMYEENGTMPIVTGKQKLDGTQYTLTYYHNTIPHTHNTTQHHYTYYILHIHLIFHMLLVQKSLYTRA